MALFTHTSVPRTYHWALLVCPTNSPPTATTGVRYHVTNSIQSPTPETPKTPKFAAIRLQWAYYMEISGSATRDPLYSEPASNPSAGFAVLVSQVADPANADAAAVLEDVLLVQDDKAWT
ncbi:hypothetical protein DV736_g3249, partial [Chaetothyriales sp. CBS 134916]